VPVKTRLWPKVLLIGSIAAAVYLIFFREDTHKSAPNRPTTPGWTDLILCSETISLDGKKTLSLGDDGTATLTEEGDDKKENAIKGKWSYDAKSQRYAVTTNGMTTTYTIASPQGSCMLVKGEVQAADLHGSWFSSTSNEEVPDDREPPHHRSLPSRIASQQRNH
jgi:hypothetical protein